MTIRWYIVQSYMQRPVSHRYPFGNRQHSNREYTPRPARCGMCCDCCLTVYVSCPGSIRHDGKHVHVGAVCRRRERHQPRPPAGARRDGEGKGDGKCQASTVRPEDSRTVKTAGVARGSPRPCSGDNLSDSLQITVTCVSTVDRSCILIIYT